MVFNTPLHSFTTTNIPPERVFLNLLATWYYLTAVMDSHSKRRPETPRSTASAAGQDIFELRRFPTGTSRASLVNDIENLNEHQKQWKPSRAVFLALLALCLLCLGVLIDSTSLSTALPVMSSELGGTALQAFVRNPELSSGGARKIFIHPSKCARLENIVTG
jgi:hypothetical protein